MKKMMLVVTIILMLLGGSLASLPISSVKAATSPSVDGTAGAFCGHDANSCTAILTTTSSNEVVVVYTFEQLDLQTSCTFSVSDSAGLSWSVRSQASGRNDGTTGTNRDQMAEFWAVSSGALSSDSITESISGCAGVYGGEYNGLIGFGVSGASLTTTFDPNVSLPGTASGFGTGSSATISTSFSNDLVIGGTQFSILTPGTGFTLINSVNGGNQAAEQEVLASPGSVNVSFSGNTNYWEIIADAIQPAVAPSPDFSLSANPSALTILIGTSGQSVITVTSVGSFSKSVSLTASVPQHGLSAKLSQSNVQPTPGSPATSTLSISSTKTTAAGSYAITIMGKSGKLAHSIAVTINVVTSNIPFGLDGSNSFFCGHDTNSCTTTLSTSFPNDIVIVYATEALDLQASCTFTISDTAGLTWNARSAIVFSPDGRDQIQEFWAKSSSSLSSDTITESILGCAGVYGGEYNGLMAFGISGAKVSSPFDLNVSLPSLGSATNDPTAVQISTSNANDIVIAGVWHGAAVPTAGAGFIIITSFAGGPEAAEYQLANATQTNATVSFQSSANSYWVMIADAVQSA